MTFPTKLQRQTILRIRSGWFCFGSVSNHEFIVCLRFPNADNSVGILQITIHEKKNRIKAMMLIVQSKTNLITRLKKSMNSWNSPAIDERMREKRMQKIETVDFCHPWVFVSVLMPQMTKES